MVNQLKSLLGKLRKPVIVNGKLLMDERTRQLMFVSLDNYKVIFTQAGKKTQNEEHSRNDTESAISRSSVPTVGYADNIVYSEDDCERILREKVSTFYEDYGCLVTSEDKNNTEVTASIDAFTGAVVIKTPLFNRLLEDKFHNSSIQYSNEIATAVNKFTAEYTANYFELYLTLLNKRIMASHMPIYVKGHLVSGLFQPVVVGTRDISSPFDLADFSWFRDYIHDSEIYLERINGSSHKLDISCIAMCDVASLFKVKCLRNLDRRYFMFLLTLGLLQEINVDASTALSARYTTMLNKVKDNAQLLGFFADLLSGIKEIRTQIKLR